MQADSTPVVATMAGDTALQRFDPVLLAQRERDLRVQLETGFIDERYLDNIRTVALDAQEPRTRFAAIQALGRSGSSHAQDLLMELFDDVEEHGDRRIVLGYIRPSRLGEPSAEWMLAKLAEEHLAPEFKRQMTFALVLAELTESQTEGAGAGAGPSRLLARVPPGWRDELLKTYRSITTPGN